MKVIDWAGLSAQQLGKYAEYIAKMEFLARGFQVYMTEVDDRGIDFVVRRDGGAFYEVQAKSLRGGGYVFFPKDKLTPSPERLVALLIFGQSGAPEIYLIPSLVWLTPNALFVSRDYGPDKKSRPEWGVQVSAKHLPQLSDYRLAERLEELGRGAVAWKVAPVVGEELQSSLERGLHSVIRRRTEATLGPLAHLPTLSYCPLQEGEAAWFPVPGMYGGFKYWLELGGAGPALMVESWIRVVEGSGQRHRIDAAGVHLVAEGFC